MGATGRKTMERKHSYGGNAFRSGRWRVICAAALSFVLALALSGTAFAQNVAVTGTVTSTGGTPLPGVTVRVQGTDARTLTDASGRYRITAPSDAVLTFSLVGQRPVQTTVAGRSSVDVTMAQIPYLEEVVVTAYTAQRRGDITGAGSSVNVGRMQRGAGARVLPRPGLAGAPGGGGRTQRRAPVPPPHPRLPGPLPRTKQYP